MYLELIKHSVRKKNNKVSGFGVINNVYIDKKQCLNMKKLKKLKKLLGGNLADEDLYYINKDVESIKIFSTQFNQHNQHNQLSYPIKYV